MDNRIIQDFKNKVGIEPVLKALNLDYEIKGEDAVLSCPFHEETIGSFRINLETGIHHCFGCNHSGGSIINFVMEYKKVGFVQALEIISELTGIELPKEVDEIDKHELVKRKLVHMRQNYFADQIDTDHTIFYQALLDESNKQDAIEYLKNRGIQQADLVVEKMKIRMLKDYSQANQNLLEKFKAKYLIDAGIMGDKHNLIFYNHRLLFPFIQDDEIVYLSARTLEKDHNPKYLNLLGKSIKGFYNVNDLKNNETIFVCEGITDTVAMVGLGLPAVGIAGAQNIDIKTLELLNDKRVIVAFDSDSAGQKGQKKLNEVLQFIAKCVILYQKDEKDILDSIQTKEGQDKIKEFYEQASTCNSYR